MTTIENKKYYFIYDASTTEVSLMFAYGSTGEIKIGTNKTVYSGSKPECINKLNELSLSYEDNSKQGIDAYNKQFKDNQLNKTWRYTVTVDFDYLYDTYPKLHAIASMLCATNPIEEVDLNGGIKKVKQYYNTLLDDYRAVIDADINFSLNEFYNENALELIIE